MRITVGLAIALACFSIIPTATAVPPTLAGVMPRGLERGKTTALTLAGPGVGRGTPEVRTALPGTLGPVRVVGPDQIGVDVAVPIEATVGYHAIRVRTDAGLSAPLIVAVGALPESTETEPNGDPASATTVPLPATRNATSPGADRDLVRFEGRRGHPVVVEVEARRIGSALDPAIAVLDPSGRPLTSDSDAARLGGDPRLVFDPPSDGPYLVEVRDIKYAGAGEAPYRLKLGEYASADAIFPLGWRRGETVALTWLGGNLPEPIRADISLPADPDLARFDLDLPGSPTRGAGPFRLVLGDEPETIEPETADRELRPLPVGTVMNGRIDPAGEVDRYHLAVTPGQPLRIEVEAAAHGSKLDGVLTLANPAGATLAEADDGPTGPDPALVFAAPADVREVTVSVRDLLGRGGPAFGYRLAARPVAPDFTLKLAIPSITIPRGATVAIPVAVARREFPGAIQLSIPADLPGIRAEGGLIPAGAVAGTILLSANGDTPLASTPLQIWGSSDPPSQPTRRRARAADNGPALAAAVAEAPPIVATVEAKSITFVHGQSAQLAVKIDRPPGNKSPVALATSGLPTLVTGGTAAVGPELAEATLTFNVGPTAAVGRSAITITATYQVDGRDEAMSPPPIAARVATPYALEVLSQALTLAAGSKSNIVALIRREAPFEGPVEVTVEGSLPPGLVAKPATAGPGVALAPIEIEAGPGAVPGAYDLLLRASTAMAARKQTKDYQIPDTPIRLTVTPAPAAPVAASP